MENDRAKARGYVTSGRAQSRDSSAVREGLLSSLLAAVAARRRTPGCERASAAAPPKGDDEVGIAAATRTTAESHEPENRERQQSRARRAGVSFAKGEVEARRRGDR